MPGHWFTAGTALYGLDCRAVLPVLKDASVDSVVTDPPYELGFMGKSWDSKGIAYDTAMWREVLRVLKPGGHLVAFGGTRTYHRMAVAIEDAGFEIRDSLHWLYGSGFPKGLDVSKAIDKAAGAEREVIGEQPDRWTQKGSVLNFANDRPQDKIFVTGSPATDAARQWDGWNVALKPAHEPIVLARKPFRGTVAQNVLEHGTGALNIDACRVGATRDVPASLSTRPNDGQTYGKLKGGQPGDLDPNVGRWPPNVLLTHDCQAAGTRQVRTDGHHPAARGESGYEGGWGGQTGLTERKSGLETVTAYACAPDCPVAGLDGQSGSLTSGTGAFKRASARGGAASASIGRESRPADMEMITYGDTGGASRFFPQLNWSPEYDLPFLYQAKAPKSERPVAEGVNGHPTVKPLALMRWLCRLVTPPNGVILDPFCGTGTTLQAARLEGFRSIGCDNWDDAIMLAKVRLGFIEKEGVLF